MKPVVALGATFAILALPNVWSAAHHGGKTTLGVADAATVSTRPMGPAQMLTGGNALFADASGSTVSAAAGLGAAMVAASRHP